MTRLALATDGSCLGNPGPGGWAWALSAECWAAGAKASTTNNLMELRAVYEALASAPPYVPIEIQTDSEYVINIFTSWLDGWERNGWRTAARRPVANVQAIKLVAGLLEGRDVSWTHVKGHAGHTLNEIVDGRARDAATALQTGRVIHHGSPDCIEQYVDRKQGVRRQRE